MKKELHPGVAIGAVLGVIAVAAGIWFYTNRDQTSRKPLDDTNTYKTVGGRRLPKMAGGGGDTTGAAPETTDKSGGKTE